MHINISLHHISYLIETLWLNAAFDLLPEIHNVEEHLEIGTTFNMRDIQIMFEKKK